MATESHILKADVGRASSVAWALLCVLALTQVILVARYSALKTSPVVPGKPAASQPTSAAPTSVPAPGQLQIIQPSPTAVSAAISPPEPGSLAPTAAATPPPPVIPTPSGPPPVGSLTLPGGIPTPASVPAPGSTFPSTPTQGTPPAVTPLPAPNSTGNATAAPPGSTSISPPPSSSRGPVINELDEYLRIARAVRELGDTQGAIETLRKADLKLPDEPEIIAETALTYEQMGLQDKAMASWRQIEALGAARGGRHYTLASRKISGAIAPGETDANKGPAPILPTIDRNRSLRLGTCLVSRDLDTTVGEKLVLRVPIINQSVQPIDTQKVDIDVFFFDRVDGQRVELTIADEPVSTWVSPPVDWAGAGEEQLDIVYHRPPLTETEVRAHGRRSYHGYVVKLYYQHRLQDAAAEPGDLLEFAAPPSGGPGPENTLLPPVSQSF